MTEESQVETGNASDTPRYILLKLRGLTLFSQLDDDQFALVSRLLRSKDVARGDLVVEQGSPDVSLYIVRRGSAAVRQVDENHRERFIGKGRLRPGAIFNYDSFVSGSASTYTVEALDDLTLWVIRRDEFLALLQIQPQIKAQLVLPDASIPSTNMAKPGRQLQYAWQRPDETILMYRKKHWWAFLRTLWLIPVSLIILFVIANTPLYVVLASAYTAIQITLIVVLTIYTAWRWVDWQNDYYAISDQRVLHRERMLLLRDDQQEVPMSKIQDVAVERPTLWTILLDMGDVTLDAAGVRSRVRFTDIANPDAVARVISEQLSRARVVNYASDHGKIRHDLRQTLDLAAQEGAAPARTPRVSKRVTVRSQWRSFVASTRRLRNDILPRMRLVEGQTITYRRHWLHLLRKIAIQVILIIAYIIGLVVALGQGFDINGRVATIPLLCIVIPVGLILLGLFVYAYEDWRNDIYRLTPERVVDIDRTPFGLFGTSKREARLSMVQNVTSSTRGFIDVLLDMGDVVIQTASGDGKLTFDRVQNPRLVAHDIVSYIDAYDTTVRELEAAQRRSELSEWFGVYDELRRIHEAKKID